MSRLRSGTVGLRFTILYGAVFLVSGIGLLALTFLLGGGAFSDVERAPGQDPPTDPETDAAQRRIHELLNELAALDAQHSRQMLVGSLLALIVMALVSLVVGRLLATRVLRPLRQITAATRSISADSLDRRLAVSGPDDEVKQLADTVDELLERLETSFTAQRRFVANASHELRTPLSTVRASLDVAAAKPGAAQQTLALAERLRPQLDQVDRLLDGLLALARAQHGSLEEARVIDAAELAEEAMSDRAADIAAKGLTLSEDLPRGMGVRGDPVLLSRMVENVVDNAVVHNVEGGWIRVGAARGDGEVRLTVRSGGRVFDQQEVDRLARPFQRLAADRTGCENGSGLGLSIVAAIASAHGGRLELAAEPEGGLGVAIALPLAPTEVRA